MILSELKKIEVGPAGILGIEVLLALAPPGIA